MDKIYLPSSGKELTIEKCNRCNKEMVNVDKDELKELDAEMLRLANIRWSNPDTKKPICVRCDIVERLGILDDEEEDEETPIYRRRASMGSILGIGGFGRFGGGGFGGFGGGGFGGAGASR